MASDGEIRICARQCTTCIFAAGNKMHLNPGRLAQMIREAMDREGHIVCHSTLNHPRAAICRGFADHPHARQRSLALRVGLATGILAFVDPPATDDTDAQSTSPTASREQGK
ncbi:hypothetical protein [Nocardia pseudovaccinii]|uniref:hypothetical protein n=1 Tax=Nocardia pseudovaccinii TaxID=189540 RepID=UPI0007A55AB7|nr:hypothetical protein [Nocardia pseudovaccinii]